MRPSTALLLLTFATVAGCASFDDSRGPGQLTIERETELDWTLCFRCGDVYLAEVPEGRTLETLHRRGLELVIDLRGPAAPVDDPVRTVAAELTLEYVQLPVVGESVPDEATVDSFLGELERAGDRTLLVFCERGANSALLFAIHRAVVGGVEVEFAIEEALRVGMKAGASEDFVRAQVERLRGAEPPAARRCPAAPDDQR